MIKLSKRLQAIYNFIPHCQTLLDIGVDHCYLPISLCQGKKVDKVLASDINIEPLEVCKANIKNYGNFNIEPILSDGFKQIKQNFDCVVISGIGSKLMVNILKQRDNLNNKTLILQPQKNDYYLRMYLKDANFKISNEKVVEENNYFYTIILVSKLGKSIKDDLDIFVGPILKTLKNEFVLKKTTQRLKHLKKFINNVDKDKYNILKREIKALESYLKKQNEK